jgi:hypothetical protein
MPAITTRANQLACPLSQISAAANPPTRLIIRPAQAPIPGKDCWLRGHLDVHAAQKVATRAFRAAERWSFSGSGKPRFRRYGELESVEGEIQRRRHPVPGRSRPVVRRLRESRILVIS